MFFSTIAIGQEMGNYNYLKKDATYGKDIVLDFNTNLIISAKGLCNVEATSYVAIFSISQLGKNIDDINKRIDKKIMPVKNFINSKSDASLFLDMISFVPVYEYNVEKKIFSKDTYTEIPAGFEVKKNLHIKYKNPNLLNEIISICTKSEIYDFVKVDYISDSLEIKKKELANKAKIIIKEKLQNYQELLGEDFTNSEKNMADGFKIFYPVDMYNSYQAYNSSSLDNKKSINVNKANKSTTYFYNPISNKDFDFVINPEISKPVIQILYKIKLKVKREKKQKEYKEKIIKEYNLITPKGEVIKLDLKN